MLPLLLACTDPATPAATETPTVSTPPTDTAPHEVLVAPFLQSATPTGIWVVWETADGEDTRVSWGPTEAEGAWTSGSASVGGHGVLHEVPLTGLSPDTTYWYTAHTGGTASVQAHFRTPPAAGPGAPFRLVAASDMQRDDAWPDKWAEVVEAGIVPTVTGRWDADLPAALGMVLLPGDLVDNGWRYEDWTDDFFAGAAPLIADVPVYPVPGNHEGNSPAFFQYFHLPDNGTPGYEEHWWTTDYANLRVIGLDSNTGYTLGAQLDWLDEVLDHTCTDDTIEFVFAELHHPWRSELWPDGELDYTGDVVSRLEAFTTRCGKPSVHFFGHTHGYSRGQSRDHTHLWVDVATGGGAIDRWGSSAQVDYPEFSVTQAEYGFVVVEVEPGAFTLRRFSRGTPEAPRDNALTDEVTVQVVASPPATPTPLGPAGTVDGPVRLSASAFAHPTGGSHGASHWQISADCAAFSEPVVDTWVQHENWFQEVDTQAGADLTVLDVDSLPGGDWCWRVRYRDRGLMWSDWSAATAFHTTW